MAGADQPLAPETLAAACADADLIIVLDDGKVVGQGTHAELKAHNKTYQQIVNSQIQKGDEERAERTSQD